MWDNGMCWCQLHDAKQDAPQESMSKAAPSHDYNAEQDLLVADTGSHLRTSERQSLKLCRVALAGSTDPICGSSWEDDEPHIPCHDWDTDLGHHKHRHRLGLHLPPGM